MVSIIDSSTRLISTQLALKAIKEQEVQASTESSKRTSILSNYGVDTTPASSSNATLANLLNNLPDNSTSPATPETTPAPISTDVTSASFMASLKAQLEEQAENAATSTQAEAMLAALEDGRLTVTDPLEGISITAWDVEAESEKNITNKPGSETRTSGWSEFLKEHLKRDESLNYAKSSQGSYIDNITGDNAYFGTVGNSYYYLTWTTDTAGSDSIIV